MSVEELGKTVDNVLGGRIVARTIANGELTIVVEAAEIADVLTRLRDDKDCLFEVLIDICGVDFPERPERFEVVYHLLSLRTNRRIRVKCTTDEATPVESAIPVSPDVKAACELLGLDPLYIANEGKLIAICPPEDADRLIATMRAHPLGRAAAVIGDVIEDSNAFIQMETLFGGQRIVDWLTGEQLPRIC